MPWYSLFPNSSILLSMLASLFVVRASHTSACSPYLSTIDTDVRLRHEHVRPCPVAAPCRCVCDTEHKRLWIDCFSRQLRVFPALKSIPSNNTALEWNIDAAFNRFDNVSGAHWMPSNMRIRHLVFSGSLAYDLIVQLNLTHRNLIDGWPSKQHLFISNNDDEHDDDEDDDDAIEDTLRRVLRDSQHEYTRLLTRLTSELREKSAPIRTFALSLAGDPSAVAILYLDHNALQSVPSHALYNATGLYELYLSYNNISVLPAYAFGFSHRLTRLDLSYNRISSIDLRTFERHPKAFAGPFLIDYLDLSHNQLTALQPHVFTYLVNLRLLKLQHNQIYSLSADVWTGLYRLKYLDLSHNYLQNFTHVFYNAYLAELNQLKVTSNNISHLNPCEFLALKALHKLDLSNNNLSHLDSCSFYGLPRTTSRSSFHVHLHSNQFETLHPCAFDNFARSTIHIENNPLVCNCTLNYLLHDRKSLAYTGNECRGGYAYQTQAQLGLPAMRKSGTSSGKKLPNTSITCRHSYKYYNALCAQVECASVCAANEQLVIRIPAMLAPSRTEHTARRTSLPLLFIVFYVISIATV